MALKIIDHGSPEYDLMVQLRTDILRKPLGMTFSAEELESEKDQVLIAAFEEEKMLGCCLLLKVEGPVVRLRQMAVLNNLQGKGIGRALMQFSENIARDLGYKKLIMHARVTAVGFYEKLGYNVVGDRFEEVTLQHYIMEKSLMM